MTRAAVVTGASSGIGAATARRLAADGFEVVVGARRLDRLNEVAEPIGARAVALDVCDQASVDDFCDQVGSCDLLVNNAGGARGLAPVAEADEADWRTMFETNVLGVMRMTRALLPRLVAGGDGHVVVVGSVAALEAYPGGAGYNAAKFGARAVTSALRRELLPRLVAGGDGHVVVVGSVAALEAYPGGAGYNAAKFGARAVTSALRRELLGQPVRVTEVDPGLVETEFSLVRFDGDQARADAVYAGVEVLSAEDVADCIAWAATRPSHVNIDQIVVKPRDQATATEVFRRPC